MKRTFFLFSLLLTLLAGQLIAQLPANNWLYIHDYPSSGYYERSHYYNILPLPGGEVIVSGEFRDTAFVSGPLIQRLDGNGNEEWSWNPTGSLFYHQLTIQPVIWDSSHFIFSDQSGHFGQMDLQGNISWVDSINAFASAMILDADHNLAFGISQQVPNGPNSGHYYPRIVILDSNRQVLLDSIYTLADTFFCSQLLQTQDSNYVLLGTALFDAAPVPYMLKVDLTGNVIWSRFIPHLRAFPQWIHLQEREGELYLLGENRPLGAPNSDLYLRHMDAQGDSLAFRIIANSAGFDDAILRKNGNFALAMRRTGNNPKRLMEVDTAANIIWEEPIFVTNSAQSVACLRENEIGLLVGGTAYKGNFIYRGLVVQMDSLGQYDWDAVEGTVFADTTGNCQLDSLYPSYNPGIIKIEPGPTYISTDANGFFHTKLDSGNYWLSLANPPFPWQQICPTGPDSHFVALSSNGNTFSGLDFGIAPEFSCPNLVVDIGGTNLIRCTPATYSLVCQNVGTEAAPNAYIDVAFDSLLIVQNINGLPSTQVGPHTYRLQVGNLPIFGTVNATINVMVSCSAYAFGRTPCAVANAYPQDYCAPAHPSWDSASIAVTGTCLPGDTIEFRIANVGTGNMNAATGILIAEDDLLRQIGSIQFNSGQDTIIKIPGNGSTWTCIADQVDFHPGQSRPRATVEACGRNSTGGVSAGHVNSVPQDDLNPFTAIACHRILGSYDPNDKRGFPLGTSVDHLIEANQELEYIIRFQNTGTAPAYKVVVRDRLPAELDLTSIQLGISSHPYSFNILADNELEWTFDPIVLPDSGADYNGSQGFLKFRIAQELDHLPGTQIRNAARIYFDYNAAVITDTAWHTIADSSEGIFLVEIDEVAPDNRPRLMAYPNPFRDQVTLALPGGAPKQLRVEVFNLQGRLLRKQVSNSSSSIVLERGDLKAGVYIFRLWSGDELMGSGKLIAQ